MTATELRAVRVALSLTQRAMATLLGYSTNTIARAERGEIPVTLRLEMVIRILQSR